MNLIEEILALLKTQFPGVREDGLQQLAAGISLQVATKEEAASERLLTASRTIAIEPEIKPIKALKPARSAFTTIPITLVFKI